MRRILFHALTATALAASAMTGHGQELTGSPADPKYKMTTPIAPGVATPDMIESSIGPLKLRDGFPTAETKEKIWDNLDRSRALQAYLLAIPIVNQAGMRDTLLKFGPANSTDVIWENLVDPKTVELTANDNTIYSFIWIDTKQRPGGGRDSAQGARDDQRLLVQVGDRRGHHRPRQGRWRKIPDPAAGLRRRRAGWLYRRAPHDLWHVDVFRSFLVDGKTGPGVEEVKNNLKIYPLAEAANPTPAKFVNASGIPSNFVMPTDYSFWELLNKVIQEEPPEGSDPTTLGLFASIGIEKGKPFAPMRA